MSHFLSVRVCVSTCMLTPDSLAQSSMTQLLTTPHFAGINGRQTASNERRTLQSSQTRKRRFFASSLNLLLCRTLAGTSLYVHCF